MLRTAFTELVGCQVPIQLAPMGGGVVTPELAIAVARGGGLGMRQRAGPTPLADRIDWFTQHWTELAEALRPLRQAAAVYEPFSPQVQETFDRARQWARSAVELVFLPELSARTAHERVPLATALHHVTSWSGWDELQRPGADTGDASAAVRLLLHALLAPTTPVTHFCPH